MAKYGLSVSNAWQDRGKSLGQFFDATLAAFERARSESAGAQDSFLIGGSSLCLHSANQAARACILPALAHLASTQSDAPSLQVAVWDSASTGVALPERPWPDDALVSRGEIQGLASDDDILVAYQPGSEQLCMLDPQSGRGVLWMPDAAECPYWDRAAPLRTLLHWWFISQSLQLVHAAAVGDERGALLLTGRGGSGKSTTALASLAAGMQYLGDDYILCDATGEQPRVHSLYNTAKVDAAARQRLSLNAANFESSSPDQEKALMFAYPDYASQLPRVKPLKAIVVPHVAGGGTHQLQRLKASSALLALAPTTLFQLPGAGSTTLGLLRRLASQIPCYSLALGTDIQSLPRELHMLLRSLA